MAPSIPNRWTTDPEYIELLNYLIKTTENVESPMSIKQLVREFKEKSGAALTVKGLIKRIENLRTIIRCFTHIDKETKAKLMFALSAPVEADFLKQLKKDAVVEIDKKKRITHYKTNDGRLELRGDHSQSAKNRTAQLESKRGHRKLVRNYFENKNIVDAVPNNEEEEEMWNLIEFISEKCVKVYAPLNIRQFTRDFNNRFGISIPSDTIAKRVRGYCREIQKGEFLDTHTKVRQLFCLSETIDSDYLKELRKDALVEVDKKNRIVHYKAKSGGLELRGDHSVSAKTKTAMFESKRSHRSLITDYFENKNNTDAESESEKEEEMRNFIDFITEKCENVNSPLSIKQLAEDFNNHIGKTIGLTTTRERINAYCREIQKTEFLDTHSKVKQLFGLGGRLDSDCLKELRKDAVVEVDDLNKITKYTANDGSLTLHGDHSKSAKKKLDWIERKKKMNEVKKHSNSVDDEDEESEKENGYSEDDSDEYSSEEFGSEFDSDVESDDLDEPGDHMEPSNEAEDFDNETSARNRSPTDATVDDNFDFDPPTERSHGSEEIEMREDEEKENNPEISESAGIKTRSGRLSKRRHLDSDFSYNLVNSRSSATPTSSGSAPSRPAKQRKRASEKEQASSSSNQSRSSSRSIRRSARHSSFPSSSTESEENMENHDGRGDEENSSEYHGPRIQEMDDYDWNPRENNHPESSPIDNNLEESKPPTSEEHNLDAAAQSADSRSDAVAPEPKPEKESLTLQNKQDSTPQTNGNDAEEHNLNKKTQNTDKRSDADVPEPKPEKESLALQNNQNSTPQTNGNEFVSIESHIHFLKALRPMMATLDTPTFAEDKLRIDKTIEKFQSIGNEEEKIRMNEIRTCLMTCLLIVERSAKKEIVKGEDTTSFETFLSLFQSYLVLLELKELDGFIKRVKHLKNEPKVNEKKVPTRKVQFALHSIIEIIAP